MKFPLGSPATDRVQAKPFVEMPEERSDLRQAEPSAGSSQCSAQLREGKPAVSYTRTVIKISANVSKRRQEQRTHVWGTQTQFTSITWVRRACLCPFFV